MRKLGTFLFWALALCLLPDVALAADAVAGGGSATWGYGLGAGLAVGLAGLGCGIGQGKRRGPGTLRETTDHHVETVGRVHGPGDDRQLRERVDQRRNPGAAGSMFVNYILGMVLIESIAIYGLVIAFQLVGKIPG